MRTGEEKVGGDAGALKKATVETAHNGWVVRNGKDVNVFVRWESVVIYLEGLLTTTRGRRQP